MRVIDKKNIRVDDLEAYSISFDLSNKVWDIVLSWNSIAQNTVGTKLIKAVDSVSANIAEGFGRFGKKDKIRFYRISRASVQESIDWLDKAVARKLITTPTHTEIRKGLNKIPKLLNGLIKVTNDNLKQ